jgi:hypothetical protein
MPSPSPQITVLPKMPPTPVLPLLTTTTPPLQPSRRQLAGEAAAHSSPSVSSATIARLFTVMEELKSGQSDLKAIVNTLLLRLPGVAGTDVVDVLREVTVPLDNDSDVEALEEKLCDQPFRKCMIHQLSLIGGSRLEDAVRRILSKLFTNKLALSYNWTGTGQKKSVSRLNVTSVIKRAVRANPVHKFATDAQIERVIKEWFRCCMDRDGGRQHRRIRQINHNSQPSSQSVAPD